MGNKTTVDKYYRIFIDFWVRVGLKLPLPEKIKSLIKYDTVSYLFIGALTTLVDFIVYFFTRLLGAGVEAATTIAWISAVLFAFFPNKTLVFNNSNYKFSQVLKELLNFILSRVFSYVCSILFMALTVSLLSFNEPFMKVLASIFVLTANYITMRLFVFKNKPASEE